jgi:hypothetical protein
MKSADLLRTLSGCKFYRSYQQLQDQAPPAAARSTTQHGYKSGCPPDPETAQAVRNRLFVKYCAVLGVMLVGVVVLFVVPLWLVYPPYAEACLLALPPMVLCALSWMAGAWWGSSKNQLALMAVTLGAIPMRVLLVLVWAWLVFSIPGMVKLVFVLALMGHWMVFAIPEIAMVIELTGRTARPSPAERTSWRAPAMGPQVHATHERPWQRHWRRNGIPPLRGLAAAQTSNGPRPR